MLKSVLAALLLFPFITMAAKIDPVGWGVVSAFKTTVYDKTGKPAGELNGGEYFIVLREVKMNKAPAYYIEVKGKKAIKGVVSAADNRYFAGPIPVEGAPSYAAWVKDRDFCQEYYGVCAMRDRVVEKKREQHFANSPEKRLKEAKKELAQAVADAKRYKAEYEKAGGNNSQRLKAQDLYKEARFVATGLKQDIERLEGEVDSWTAAHPFNEEAIKQSAVWKRLNAQVEKMAPQMDALNAKYPDSLPKAAK